MIVRENDQLRPNRTLERERAAIRKEELAHHRTKRDIGYENDCVKCPVNETLTRPTPEQFKKQLYWYLQDAPGEDCPFGGKAAYRSVTSP